MKLWPARADKKPATKSRGFTHRLMSLVDRDAFIDGYPFGALGSLFGGTLVGDKEQIGQEFLSYVRQAYKGNPVIFSLAVNRLQVFSEARFQFRERTNGRPGRVFGTTDLAPLEKPWFGGSTRQMLAMAEVHNACAGNFFAARIGDQVRVMRPDWTWLILGSPNDDAVGPLDLEAEVIGYLYFDGGRGNDPRLLMPEQVAHYKPTPDPELPYRGMSWITPIIEDLLGDKAMTRHKKKFMEAGATPNLAIKLNIEEMQEFQEWVEEYKEQREEASLDANPYKTLFLAATADPVPIGAHLRNVDFTNVQAAGEVRMAAAAGVNPTVAGMWAGLQGAALNAGNFEAAWAQFINQTIRNLWSEAADAFSTIIDIPSFVPTTVHPTGVVELWLDDRDIPALQEDAKKAADVAAQDASTISTLFMAGWDADAIVRYIQTRDPAELLGQHSGETSVQLQASKSANGNGNGAAARLELPAGH